MATWVGCGQKSPEERVAELRSYYSARLNGFIVDEEPVFAEPSPLEAPLDEEASEAAGEQPSAEAAASAEFAPETEIALRQRVHLDILIQHRSPERLPGLTVDISMADSGGREKGSWRAWFDTSNMAEATVTQFTHILEDVGYEEGDGFFVEVRHPVPVEERGEYREFAASS